MTDTTTTTRLDPGVLKLGVIIVAGAITAMLDMTMVAVALADLTRAFHASVTTIQWVSTAYLLAIAMVIPVTGRLAERFGARGMWMFALTAFLAGSALCGAAWSASSLIAFRALQGVGGGMIVPLSMMTLAQAAGPEQRGRVMAIVAMPAQVAPILGPLIGGVIVDAGSWRWIFYVNVPICLLALLLAWRGIPGGGTRERGERWLDVTGLVLLAPGLALTLYGLAARTARLPLLAAGIVLLAVFTVHALRSRGVTPLLNLRLFSHRSFTAEHRGRACRDCAGSPPAVGRGCEPRTSTCSHLCVETGWNPLPSGRGGRQDDALRRR
jgi:EmrB/QacA subfamily drug resistance transporter